MVWEPTSGESSLRSLLVGLRCIRLPDIQMDLNIREQQQGLRVARGPAASLGIIRILGLRLLPSQCPFTNLNAQHATTSTDYARLVLPLSLLVHLTLS